MALAGCFILGLAATIFYRRHTQKVFFTTSSPFPARDKYVVSLRGNPQRSFLLTHQVTADVLKSGEPYVSDIFLHSSHNAFDLSFESGFPDSTWLGNRILEFYHKGDYERGRDSVAIQNDSNVDIKYLRVLAVNKLLLFDIPPLTSVQFVIPAANTGSQTISLEGSFSDNQPIPFQWKSFDRRATAKVRTHYQIRITRAEVQFEEQPTLPIRSAIVFDKRQNQQVDLKSVIEDLSVNYEIRNKAEARLLELARQSAENRKTVIAELLRAAEMPSLKYRLDTTEGSYLWAGASEVLSDLKAVEAIDMWVACLDHPRFRNLARRSMTMIPVYAFLRPRRWV
jgi:hypothetical protein